MTANPTPPDVPLVEAVFCRRCQRAVSTHIGPGGVTFLHAVELRGDTVDHRADPVPVTEIDNPLIECDFCSAPDAAWIYRCADRRTDLHRITARVVGGRDYRDQHRAARVRRTDTEYAITEALGERWMACSGCATLIEARDIYGLIGRVVDAMPAKLTRGKRLVRVRGDLHGTYSAVFDTLEPGRGRIEPGHPLGVWPTAPDETSDKTSDEASGRVPGEVPDGPS
jgi:hypothetical protein